jgi:hypothetical protein
MAKVSRRIQFEELDSESFRKVHDFRDKYLGKIEVSFGSTPGTATIEWNTPEQLQLLEELANDVASKEN